MKFAIIKSSIFLLTFVIFLANISFTQTEQRSDEIDLKGCIPMYREKYFVIKDKESYLKNLRNDAQTEQCKADAENLDFKQYSFVGIQINSGYCRTPLGLKHNIIKDNSKKQYVLIVNYTDPEGQVCRALSRYDLWLQVPKLEEDHEVVFEIKPIPRISRLTEN